MFSEEEIQRISQIVLKFPNCIVCEDAVYEHLLFEYDPLTLPRFQHIPEMQSRTVSIHSAGKLFSCTGSRMGWIIGPESIVKSAQAYHQYNVFCLSAMVQEATANALEATLTNGYFKEFQQYMIGLRNKLLDILLESSFDLNLWVPQSGYFIITDASQVAVREKYLTDATTGLALPKDFALAHQIAYENGVISIPCSDFFGQSNKNDSYVRFAFCKDDSIIEQARSKLKLV